MSPSVVAGLACVIVGLVIIVVGVLVVITMSAADWFTFQTHRGRYRRDDECPGYGCLRCAQKRQGHGQARDPEA